MLKFSAPGALLAAGLVIALPAIAHHDDDDRRGDATLTIAVYGERVIP